MRSYKHRLTRQHQHSSPYRMETYSSINWVVACGGPGWDSGSTECLTHQQACLSIGLLNTPHCMTYVAVESAILTTRETFCASHMDRVEDDG